MITKDGKQVESIGFDPAMIFAWDVGSSVTWAEAALLSALARNLNVLEIGSWLGRSTIALASTAKHVTSVDWHQGDFHAGEGDTEAGFRANLERYGIDNVEVVVKRIEDVDWDPGQPFDGVFIDAAHDAESVARHWQIALEHARQGGWVAFHDYGRFDVTDFVDSLERQWEGVESVVWTVL